jgi:hypothetical protein
MVNALIQYYINISDSEIEKIIRSDYSYWSEFYNMIYDDNKINNLLKGSLLSSSQETQLQNMIRTYFGKLGSVDKNTMKSLLAIKWVQFNPKSKHPDSKLTSIPKSTWTPHSTTSNTSSNKSSTTSNTSSNKPSTTSNTSSTTSNTTSVENKKANQVSSSGAIPYNSERDRDNNYIQADTQKCIKTENDKCEAEIGEGTIKAQENDKNRKITNIIDVILVSGPIKFLVIVYCLCILYVIIYAGYRLLKFINKINLPKRIVIDDPTSNLEPVFDIVIDPPSYTLFMLVIHVLGWLSCIFLIIYLIWCAFKAVGLQDMLLVFEIFRDMRDYGIIGLFDGLFYIFPAPVSAGNKAVAGTMSIFDFLKSFMKEAFGILIPDYTIDEDVLNANVELAKNAINNNLCEEDVKNLRRTIDSKPLLTKININFVDKFEDKPKSQEDIMKVENCIKENTKPIPEDAKTGERLNIIYENEISRQRCMNQDIVNNFEDTFKYSVVSISKSIENNTSNLTNSVNKKVDSFMDELAEKLGASRRSDDDDNKKANQVSASGAIPYNSSKNKNTSNISNDSDKESDENKKKMDNYLKTAKNSINNIFNGINSC